MTAISRESGVSDRYRSTFARVRSRLAIFAVIAIVLPFTWLVPIDGVADKHVQAGLGRALATFAIARAANGVISVVQESTVNVTLGIGGTLAIGQILDPLNDLVEQFSTLMLAASISFAIQLALLEVGKTFAVSVALTLIVICWAAGNWLAREPPLWLAKCLVLFLVARFAVPLVALGSEFTYQTFLAPKHMATEAKIGVATGEMEDQFKLSSVSDLRALPDKLRGLKAKADTLVENVVKVMAVFIVQTIVLPLVFLWLVVWLARELFGWRTSLPGNWREQQSDAR